MRTFDYRWRLIFLSMVLGGAVALSGCASTATKDIKDIKEAETRQESSSPAEAKKKADEKKTGVEYVNVVGDGDRVMIGTTGPIKYTVFKLSDPSRLIVDMPGVSLEKVGPAIPVNNEFLNEITVVSYGDEKDISRIIIGLKEGVDHEVKSGENSILVSLKRGAIVASAQPQEPAPPAAPETRPEAPVKEEPVKAGAIDARAQDSAEKAPEPAAPAPAKKEEAASKATKIVSVSTSREGENTVIRIKTDGAIGNFNSFDLDTPSRIVVDIWGVDNAVGKDLLNLKGKYVKDIRIGSHDDKSRLVFDAAKGLPPHSVKKAGDSIVVTLGPKVKNVLEADPLVSAAPAAKETARAAAPAAPVKVAATTTEEMPSEAPAPAPASAPEPAAAAEKAAAPAQKPAITVTSIDFKKLDGKGRIIIAASSKPEFTIKESLDGKTLVVDLLDSVLPGELVRTLDAAKLKTPVSTISSYQETMTPVRDVRVLVQLNDKAAYTAKQDGGVLNIDFPLPSSVVQSPSPKIVQTEPALKEFNGKKIDLDMIDANISDILRLLAEVSNLNIIASDDVKGTISLRLKNVPWDQAFDIILKSKDLDMMREGNVIRVAPAAKIRQEKESTLASRRAQEKLENLEIQFVPVNYASSADLIKQVQSTLTERGSVTSDSRTNTLIVKDLKPGIEAAAALIKKLDTPIPQVLIEARIVEASSSFARDLGIQWGVDYQTGGHVSTNTFGSTTQTGEVPPAPGTLPGPKTFTAGKGVQNVAVNLPATGLAGPLGALGFVLGKAGSNPLVLDLRLSAGESEGRLKTISRPRITTMDNKEAKIEQGESVPFETVSAAGTQTIFIDANLALIVTPHITPDGSIFMKIKATRNSIGTFRTSSGQPSINKKESSTEVLVQNGETTVIGGIVISDKSETEKGIPLLKDIPVFGWLFKSKSISDTQSELLIFITPTIVKDKDKITG